jgi:flavin reductase (DIM6/NTAB) family NADH-FMN oxidoreductase RutF/DNA-binding IclR family transcriptional regulator
MSTSPAQVESDLFRRVLGHFPTGVAVITAMSKDGRPVGMAAFLPAVTSTTWPQIEASGGFCVNILSAEQEAWSRSFGRSGADKFAGVSWYPSPNGAPVLEDALAWIDCHLYRVDQAGDHYVVFGEVKDMRVQSASAPLVFFRGGYGAFQSASLVAGDPRQDLAVPLRLVDGGRPLLEEFSERAQCQVAVTALVGDQIVVLAVAGATAEDRASGTFIGQRVRATAPIGASFMAWEPADRVASWVASAPAEHADALAGRLESIRSAGMAFSLEGGGIREWQDAMSAVPTDGDATRQKTLADRVLQSFQPQIVDPEAARVKNLHVPVLGPDGRAALFLNVGGFSTLDNAGLAELVAGVKDVARRISESWQNNV